MEYSVRRCQEQARCLSDGRTGRLSPSSRMLSTPDPSRFRAMTTPWPRESGLRPENRPVGRPAYDPNMLHSRLGRLTPTGWENALVFPGSFPIGTCREHVMPGKSIGWG